MSFGLSMLALQRQAELLREADQLRTSRAATGGRRPAGHSRLQRINRLWDAKGDRK